MAKFTILAATFLAILFLVDASIYRTTVTIDETADDENYSPQRCREQVQMQQNLNRCQEFFMRQVMRGRIHRANDENDENDDNWDRPQQDPFRACCNQIQRMDAQCRCEGLRMAIQQQRSRGQLQGHEMMAALRAAEELPSRCGVSPRRCRFGSRYMD
ncbi:2S sulfur-rich seed storage protein 2 [Euphorbia peplus]|nr:2S sulfur-rich seed storage protein 2 [Euphorbia peplus]